MSFLQGMKGMVFISATFTTSRREFRFFRKQLGLEEDTLHVKKEKGRESFRFRHECVGHFCGGDPP